VTVLHRARLDARGVGADVRLGHAERHHDLAGGHARQVLPLERLAAVLDDRHGREHVEVDRRGAAGAGAGRADLVQQDGRLRHAEPRAAVLLRDDRAEPAGLGERADEVPRVLVLAIALEPVVERERARERAHFLADHLLLLGEREVHARDSIVGYRPAQEARPWRRRSRTGWSARRGSIAPCTKRWRRTPAPPARPSAWLPSAAWPPGSPSVVASAASSPAPWREC